MQAIQQNPEAASQQHAVYSAQHKQQTQPNPAQKQRGSHLLDPWPACASNLLQDTTEWQQ